MSPTVSGDMRSLAQTTSESEQAPARGNTILSKLALLLVGIGALVLVLSISSGFAPHSHGTAAETMVVSKFLNTGRDLTGACSPVPSGAGFKSDCEGKIAGQSCTVQCGNGYTMSGTAQTYTCQASGAFSGSGPTCTPMPCDTTSIPVTEGNSCSGKTTSQTCTVKCRDGYAGPDSLYVCATSGQFAPISSHGHATCDAMPCHTGFQYETTGVTSDCRGKTTGQTCNVTCETGYTMNPSTQTVEVMTCQGNGKFAGATVKCVANDCVLSGTPPAGVVNTCTDKVTGQTCQSQCGLATFGTPVTHTCDPATGEFSAGSPTCTPCGTDCAECTSATACTKCTNGAFLHQGTCLADCSSAAGTYADDTTGPSTIIGNICKACETGCSACNAQGCSQCETGKFLMSDTKKCVDACPIGYATNGASCQSCSTNCRQCSISIGGCTECKNSKFLYEGYCIQECPENTYGAPSDVAVGRQCKLGSAPATPAPASAPASDGGSTSLCASFVAWGACFSALTAGKSNAEIAAICALIRQSSPLPSGISRDVVHMNAYYQSGADRATLDHALDNSGHCPTNAKK